MKLVQFSALVRVPTSGGGHMLVRTQVYAEDAYRASLLLQQQYGKNAVVGVPQKLI